MAMTKQQRKKNSINVIYNETEQMFHHVVCMRIYAGSKEMKYCTNADLYILDDKKER
jgi:hypothetical protein